MIWFPEHPDYSAPTFDDVHPISQSFEHELLNLEQTGVGAFDWRLDTNELQVSDSYRQLLGNQPEDEMGLLAYIHPEHRPKASREIRQAASKGRVDFEGLYRMHGSTEQTQVFLLRASLYRQGERPIRMVGLAIDVTNILKLVLRFGE